MTVLRKSSSSPYVFGWTCTFLSSEMWTGNYHELLAYDPENEVEVLTCSLIFVFLTRDMKLTTLFEGWEVISEEGECSNRRREADFSRVLPS